MAMKNKIDESKIIDYLYGELPEKEMKKVEEFLSKNPEEYSKFVAFESTRDILGKLEDKEMIPPSFIFNEGENTVSFFQSAAFRWVSSIAAGLVILLISASLTRFNIANTDQGILIGFGELKISKPEMTKENVQAWMSEVMNQYEDNTNDKINAVETKLASQIADSDDKMRNSMLSMMKKSDSKTDALMREYVAQLNDENKSIIKGFMTVSAEQQKEYMNNVLADFNDFYQTQRTHDLQIIETSLGLMKNNYDVKQIEQDQLLASLYTMVNTNSN